MRATTKSYITGFLLSCVCTITAYLLVANHLLIGGFLSLVIVGLGLLQLLIQLLFFLHLGKKSQPKWNMTVFLFLIFIIVIIVGGSLWIMSHLNYTLMLGKQDTSIIKDEGMQQYLQK